MIVLFTDFGPTGPYQGQVRAVLARAAPGVPVIDLLCDAPAYEPQAAAYLLAALASAVSPGAVFLAVIDPGVGGARAPLVVAAGDRWFVGPDNGLFAIVARRAPAPRIWDITWRPGRLSASFHARDLFAPVAARLALGAPPPGMERRAEDNRTILGADWPDDLPRVVYVDHFGNAMTGLRAAILSEDTLLEVGGARLHRARTFCDVPPGKAFWYENANGLAEIAVNRGAAARELGLVVGTEVVVLPARR